MSIRVMTQVWELNLPDSQKIVLLALADCANDEGIAWPSMATLRVKCSKGERTVQGVIQQLVAAGHLTRHENPGRGCTYTIHPRKDGTPAVVAPRSARAPQRMHRTPATAAGHPRSGCGQSVIEPSLTVKGGHAASLNDDGEKPGGDAVEGSGAAGGAGKPPAAETRAHPLPEDWQPPVHADLPPMAAELVRQWPSGAYEAVCETFRLHWHSETRLIGRKKNWNAALGKWIINDHPKVMRDAKAGVSFAALAPVRAAGATAVPGRAMLETPAKAREDEWSQTIHALVKREAGEAMWTQWIQPSALLLVDVGGEGYGMTVIAASEFQRQFLEERFTGAISNAVKATTGLKPRWVRFDVERAAAKEKVLVDG